jgi:Ca2+/Na+ antiporter
MAFPSRTAWTLAALPALWAVGFGAFLLRARWELGRWPLPAQPDPKDLGWDVHHLLLVLGIPLMMAGVVILLAGAIRIREWRLPATLGLSTLVLLIAVARVDPGYAFTWLAD